MENTERKGATSVCLVPKQKINKRNLRSNYHVSSSSRSVSHCWLSNKLINRDPVSECKSIHAAFRGSLCFSEPGSMLCMLEVIGCITQNHKHVLSVKRSLHAHRLQTPGLTLWGRSSESETDSDIMKARLPVDAPPLRSVTSTDAVRSILMFCFCFPTGAHLLQTNESVREVTPVSQMKIQRSMRIFMANKADHQKVNIKETPGDQLQPMTMSYRRRAAGETSTEKSFVWSVKLKAFWEVACGKVSFLNPSLCNSCLHSFQGKLNH